jgi:AraC-like DNA-binding protein
VALRQFVLHHHLNESGAVPLLVSVSARRSALAYSVLQHDVPAIDAFYDAALVYGMQVMRLMCGAKWQPLRVSLAHRPPADVAPYTRMFGANVRFNSSVCSIEFASGLMEKPVDGADPGRLARLQEEMRLRLLKNRISFSDQVTRALRPMMLFGTVSAPNIANLFSLHERVLRNRLAAEGTSVRELIQNARLDTAAQLLRSTALSVSEIGMAVGYADPPSFVRAFRKRFGGVTPGAWRGIQ